MRPRVPHTTFEEALVAAPPCTMSPVMSGARRPGRPRSGDVDRALYSSARSLLSELGYERLSMEAVAAHAGVSKGALYRRWPSKSGLVAALVDDVWRQADPITATGDLRCDLADIVHRLISVLEDGRTGPVLATLIDAGHRNRYIAETMRSAFGRRRDRIAEVLSVAVAQGVLPQATDLELIADLMTGPIWRRYFLSGEPLPADLPSRIVDAALSSAQHSSAVATSHGEPATAASR